MSGIARFDLIKSRIKSTQFHLRCNKLSVEWQSIRNGRKRANISSSWSNITDYLRSCYPWCIFSIAFALYSVGWSAVDTTRIEISSRWPRLPVHSDTVPVQLVAMCLLHTRFVVSSSPKSFVVRISTARIGIKHFINFRLTCKIKRIFNFNSWQK